MAGAAAVHGSRRRGICERAPCLHPRPGFSPLPLSPPRERSKWEQLVPLSHGPASAGEGQPGPAGARGPGLPRSRSRGPGESVPAPGPLRPQSGREPGREPGRGGRAPGWAAAARRGRKFSSAAAQPRPPGSRLLQPGGLSDLGAQGCEGRQLWAGVTWPHGSTTA